MIARALVIAAVLAALALLFYAAPRCGPDDRQLRIGNVKVGGC